MNGAQNKRGERIDRVLIGSFYQNCRAIGRSRESEWSQFESAAIGAIPKRPRFHQLAEEPALSLMAKGSREDRNCP
jgi:hypothetical protein